MRFRAIVLGTITTIVTVLFQESFGLSDDQVNQIAAVIMSSVIGWAHCDSVKDTKETIKKRNGNG